MFKDIYNSKEHKLSQLRTKLEGSVIYLQNNIFLIYKVNSEKNYNLLNANLKKSNWKLSIKDITPIRKVPRVYFNRDFYLLLNNRNIISCRTGNIVYKEGKKRKDILSAFKFRS